MVTQCDLSQGRAALAFDSGVGHAGVVIVCAGFHAGLEADIGSAAGRVDVCFAVVGSLAGSDVAGLGCRRAVFEGRIAWGQGTCKRHRGEQSKYRAYLIMSSRVWLLLV